MIIQDSVNGPYQVGKRAFKSGKFYLKSSKIHYQWKNKQFSEWKELYFRCKKVGIFFSYPWKLQERDIDAEIAARVSGSPTADAAAEVVVREVEEQVVDDPQVLVVDKSDDTATVSDSSNDNSGRQSSFFL